MFGLANPPLTVTKRNPASLDPVLGVDSGPLEVTFGLMNCEFGLLVCQLRLLSGVGGLCLTDRKFRLMGRKFGLGNALAGIRCKVRESVRPGVLVWVPHLVVGHPRGISCCPLLGPLPLLLRHEGGQAIPGLTTYPLTSERPGTGPPITKRRSRAPARIQPAPGSLGDLPALYRAKQPAFTTGRGFPGGA